MQRGPPSKARAAICLALAAFFLAAGILHFAHTEAFARIVPPFLPAPETIVRVTGAMEIAFSIGLALPRWRRRTGRVLALYLLAVLPANVTMAVERTAIGTLELPDWALWLRVGLQFPLIALVLYATR